MGLLTGSACLGDEALLWMLPWNGPQDRPSARLRRARTHLCPSCRTCSSSSVGRDIRGVRSASHGDCPALLPAQVQPTSAASALQKQSGGCRAEEGVLPCGLGLSYRDVGWCLLQGPASPCGKTFPGDNGLQREDNEGCLQLDLSRQVHCLGCTAALSGTCVALELDPLYQEHL